MIIGIDPSLTNTAVVIGSEVDKYELHTFGSSNIGDHVAARMARYDDLVARIMKWIESVTLIVDAVYIEGYSLASKGPGNVQITEYGSLLRWHLVDMTKRIYEVAPATLKKFATGSGATSVKKDMVAAHLTKRYGVLLCDNDSYDGFGLYQLGLVAEGVAKAQTATQQEAADTARGRGATKKKKRKAKPDAPDASLF